jgi:hypothetical protein
VTVHVVLANEFHQTVTHHENTDALLLKKKSARACSHLIACALLDLPSHCTIVSDRAQMMTTMSIELGIIDTSKLCLAQRHTCRQKACLALVWRAVLCSQKACKSPL